LLGKNQYGLGKEGLCLSDELRTLAINFEANTIQAIYVFPLKTRSGTRIPKGKPKYLAMSYCPFCGRKLGETKKGTQNEHTKTHAGAVESY
jgi:hypothetical protein